MFGFKQRANERKRIHKQQEYLGGYYLAAGRLLRGDSTVESLGDEADAMCWSITFCQGVFDARDAWQKLNIER